MTESWEGRVFGVNCPLEFPRPDYDDQFYLVKKLSISTLYLNRNQTYRGYCILIYDDTHVTRIDQLTAEGWAKLANDIFTSETAVYKSMQPDHINIASIGMLVPHLHWHIIPRYKNDPRWGGPIWTSDLEDMAVKKLHDEEYELLATRIKQTMDERAK